MQAESHKVQKALDAKVVVRGADGRAYRRSVQVFFVNENGEFLVCSPVGSSNCTYRQTVQGGSEAGESPFETAVRETWEEIGLDITQCATFVAEVLPCSAGLSPSNGNASTLVPGSVEEINENGEVVSEYRAAFRYASKTWRKIGIFGQEMYPLLFFLPSQAIQGVNVRSRSRGVRQEFTTAYWGTLDELARCAPPVKMELMSKVCPAVAPTAQSFLKASGCPSTGTAA